MQILNSKWALMDLKISHGKFKATFSMLWLSFDTVFHGTSKEGNEHTFPHTFVDIWRLEPKFLKKAKFFSKRPDFPKKANLWSLFSITSWEPKVLPENFTNLESESKVSPIFIIILFGVLFQ